MIDRLKDIKGFTLQLAKTLINAAQKYEFVPMPGYTHMQKAMPTTLGTWYSSFAESLLDDVRVLTAISDIMVNQNPLGSGAGYGSPFDFDRDKLIDKDERSHSILSL